VHHAKLPAPLHGGMEVRSWTDHLITSGGDDGRNDLGGLGAGAREYVSLHGALRRG